MGRQKCWFNDIVKVAGKQWMRLEGAREKCQNKRDLYINSSEWMWPDLMMLIKVLLRPILYNLLLSPGTSYSILKCVGRETSISVWT